MATKTKQITKTDILEEFRKNIHQSRDDTQPLRDRWEKDYRKWWLLEKHREGKTANEYDNYTSNEPRSVPKKIIKVLSNAQENIIIERQGDDEHRRLADQAEKFIYGAKNLANSRIIHSLQPKLQSQKAFYSTIRGMYGELVYIRNNPKNEEETIVDIQVWDPFRMYWEVGPDGFLWESYSRTVKPAQFKAEFGKEVNTKTKLHNYWNGEINCIFPESGDEWFKLPTKHNLDHIPVILIPTGSSPYIQSDDVSDSIKDFGESFYDCNRNIYPYKNKIMTYTFTIIGQAVHNPLAFSSAGGKKTLAQSPYYKGSVVQLDSNKGETISPIWTPVMPRDTTNALQLVQSDLNLGGMSPIAMGEGHTSSGYETSLLIKEAEDALLASKEAMETGGEWEARELLTQYASGGYNELRLHGTTGTSESFDTTFTSEMVQGDWFPEYKLEPDLAEDNIAKHTMAQIAIQNRLMSRQRAAERYLGVKDPAADQDLQKVENAYDDPRVRDVTIAAQLIKDGHPELAQMFLQQMAQQQQQNPTSPFRQGISDNVQPKEEMGYTPEMDSLEQTAWPNPQGG